MSIKINDPELQVLIDELSNSDDGIEAWEYWGCTELKQSCDECKEKPYELLDVSNCYKAMFIDVALRAYEIGYSKGKQCTKK